MTPPARRFATALGFAMAAGPLFGCEDRPSARTQAQLEALQQKRAEAAKKAAADPIAPLPTDVVRLAAPYDDTQAVVVRQDGPCPEDFWALFPGEAPGASPAEKKANASRRKSLAEGLRGKTYLVRLKAPTDVALSPYDAPQGRFTIEVKGSIDCTDALGRVAIAWTDAKASDPGRSAAQAGAEISQNLWLAPPLTFEFPMTSLNEARTFSESQRFGLSARVAFTLGRAQVDRKLKKVGKASETVAGETLTIGGGIEDWGAGRLVRAELLGVRVATDREHKELIDRRPGR